MKRLCYSHHGQTQGLSKLSKGLAGEESRPITQKMLIYLFKKKKNKKGNNNSIFLKNKIERDRLISTKIYFEKLILMVCNGNDVRALVTNVQMFVLPY